LFGCHRCRSATKERVGFAEITVVLWFAEITIVLRFPSHCTQGARRVLCPKGVGGWLRRLLWLGERLLRSRCGPLLLLSSGHMREL